MTGEHLDAILKSVQAKAGKDGAHSLPEGVTITLYLAHDGASLSVAKVESVKADGELIFARTVKKETFALARADIFAIATDGSSTASGESPRRAGFGG
jgi:hypothetical protein